MAPALVRRAQGMVPVRKSWRLPAEERCPARVRRQLAAVRERGTAAGVNLRDVWPWFDGRRDVHSLWERLQYRVPCALDLLVDWVAVLARAGAVELR